MTTLIDGKAIARRIRSRVAGEVAASYGGTSAAAPGLATVLV
jgi:methylenetetrahydrofolate dehydrogenase (NADP+) / methenyltetrahydrofolate cyclohydrolase